jgi:hypothetical protein
MSGKRRLEQLKELVGRLEQLPSSAERDRVLAEVRARAVDVDTGVTPRAMLEVTVVAPYERPPARETKPPPPARDPEPVIVAQAIAQPAADDRLCLEDTPLPLAWPAGEPSLFAWKRGLRG